MDTWTKWTEFLACGLLVLPIFLGIGTGSFEVFALTLAPMLVVLIVVAIRPPMAPPPDNTKPPRPPQRK